MKPGGFSRIVLLVDAEPQRSLFISAGGAFEAIFNFTEVGGD